MTIYFNGTGAEFTEETARLAVERARELGITEFVVASNSGPSAWALISARGGDGTGVTVVTHAAGFRDAFSMEMEKDERERLEKTGALVITATHVLSGVERSFSRKHQGTYPALIMADTLRLFGQGMKVAVECSIMAADAGTLTGAKIVSIGGSGRGSDTAVVMTPGHASQLFDQLRIHEIICKPGLH
jgi:hypothetical protein